MLTTCTGWRLERLALAPELQEQCGSGQGAELALRLADLFRLQLRIGGGTATGSVELAAGGVPTSV
jgi:hypothetical protein